MIEMMTNNNTYNNNNNSNHNNLFNQGNRQSINGDSRNKKHIFPQKLWRLINDTRLNSAIRWSEDGRSFFVFEHPLKNMCLGKENNIFYTKQPKSFVRQLHLYGFRKVNKNQFMHMYFQKNQPELVSYIKRSYRAPAANDKTEDCFEEDGNKSEEDECRKDNNHSNESSSTTSSSSSSSSSPQTVPPSSILAVESHINKEIIAAAATTDQLQQVNNSYQQSTDHDKLIDLGIESIENGSIYSILTPINVDLKTNQLNSQDQLSTTFGGAVAFANEYGESANAACLEWYDNSYVDMSYNYTDDSVLTLYDNDIYPSTNGDNNITL